MCEKITKISREKIVVRTKYRENIKKLGVKLDDVKSCAMD